MAGQDLITDKERRQAEKAGNRPGMPPEFKIQPQAFTEWVVATWGTSTCSRGRRSGSSSLWTLASSIWRSTSQQARQGQRAVPPDDAGAVMMAPNGRVQAMVGSVDWAQRQFNNAVKARVRPARRRSCRC